MATYWCGAAGNDGNTGLSYAQRKATWAAALALATAKGDVVNVVADDGPLTVPVAGGATLSNRNAGTSFSDPGLTIQGTDPAGSPSMATLHFEDNTTTQDILVISNAGATDPNYIVIQGLEVDWTALTSTVHTKHFVTRPNGNVDNNIRIQYCIGRQAQFQGGLFAKDHALLISNGGRSFEVRYNVFFDFDAPGGSSFPTNGHHRGQIEIHNNVAIISGAWSPGGVSLTNFGSNDGPTSDHRVHHNTVWVTATAGGTINTWASMDTNGGSPSGGVKHLHSNVYADFRASGNRKYATGGNAASTSYTRVMGYTLFSTAINTWDDSGPYETQWDPDDSDSPEGTSFWATDVLTASDVFFDSGTPWTWANINGSGYSIDLPADLRIADTSNWRTMSIDGGVPGAIADSVAVGPLLTIDKAAIGVWQVGTECQFSLTVRNAGDTTATEQIVVTDTLPAGLTYKAASGSGWVVSVSAGVITATWAGDIVAGDVTLPLVITVQVAEAAAPSVTNTAHVESLDDPVGGDDTEIITVLPAAPEVPPGNPSVLLSEQAPGFPVLRVGTRIKHNLDLSLDMDAVGDSTGIARLWSATVELPPGATDIELPMLLVPTALMLQTDQDITIQINSDVQPLMAGGCFLITQTSEVNTFAVTNLSALKAAHLQYCGTGDVTQPSGSVQDPDGGRGDDAELN